MKIINPNVGSLEAMIGKIDDKIILGLANVAFRCNKDTERFNLRDELYTSQYNPKNLSK